MKENYLCWWDDLDHQISGRVNVNDPDDDSTDERHDQPRYEEDLKPANKMAHFLTKYFSSIVRTGQPYYFPPIFMM